MKRVTGAQLRYNSSSVSVAASVFVNSDQNHLKLQRLVTQALERYSLS